MAPRPPGTQTPVRAPLRVQRGTPGSRGRPLWLVGNELGWFGHKRVKGLRGISYCLLGMSEVGNFSIHGSERRPGLALALVKGKLRTLLPKFLGPAYGVPDWKQDVERTVGAESPGTRIHFYLDGGPCLPPFLEPCG